MGRVGVGVGFRVYLIVNAVDHFFNIIVSAGISPGIVPTYVGVG